MISNLPIDHSLYMIGTGVLAHEMAHWIQQGCDTNIIFVEPDQFNAIPKMSCCVLGFAIPEYRNRFFDSNNIDNMVWPHFIHPLCFMGGNNAIGKGTVIYPNVHVGYETQLGDFVFVHQNTNIGHKCKIGSYSLISPTVSIGGGTTVGSGVNVGMSTVIKDSIEIGNNVDFMMSSVVTKSILEPGAYFGNRKSTSPVTLISR